MRKYLYTPTTGGKQGSLWFSYAELNLNKNKMFVTEKNYPNVYSTTGFINLGDTKHYHTNAVALSARFLKDMGTNACIYFVPLIEMPFICYKDENGEVKCRVIGYFDYAKTVFQKINWDNDYSFVGLIEEINEGQWDIIEE